MTCPSVSVPQNSRSADEKLAGHCACALSSWEKNKTDMSFLWTWGRRGLKGSWQEYTRARTHAETRQMGASCGPLTHFEDLAMGVPPQTLSSPSRSVALFVIVIRTLFVKGSLAVCSRRWVYICTRVYLQKSAGWRSAVTSLPLGFLLSHPVYAVSSIWPPLLNLSQKW